MAKIHIRTNDFSWLLSKDLSSRLGRTRLEVLVESDGNDSTANHTEGNTGQIDPIGTLAVSVRVTLATPHIPTAFIRL